MTGITIGFGGYQGPESVHSRAAEVLRDGLRRRLGDAVSFEIVGNVIDAGRKASDLLGMVERGELAMCYFSSSYLADRVPELGLLDLPFVLEDRSKAYAALDGPLGALLAERLAEVSSYRLLGFWDNGIRHLSNRVRPLRGPSDCTGLLIRTLFSDLHEETFRLLGFETVRLDVKDLIEGVRAGTIDAQDNALTNIWNFRLYEQHRHVTLTGHFFGAAAVLCHGPSHDGWPGDIRAAVYESLAEATAAQREFAAAEDMTALAGLRDAGVEIVDPSPGERQAFVDAVRPVVEAQRERFGEELFACLT